MSKYTTKVRFVCENIAGDSASVGMDEVDSVIAKSWDKVFSSKVKFFDEDYRSVLCSKILKHYYLREIGVETVGVWKLWMNERLEMIMPYYNQLYESALLKFEPLQDVNVTMKSKRDVVGNKTESGNSESSSKDSRETSGSRDTESSGSAESTNRDLYSDTPQGTVKNLEDNTYLTNARKVTDSGSSNGKEGVTYSETMGGTGSVTGTTSSVGNSNSTDEYLETVVGKQGSGSFSKMLNEFRETFLNIDMQVVDEFADLFMGLW